MKKNGRIKIEEVKKILNLKKIFLPIAISLGILCLIIYRDDSFKVENLYLIKTAKVGSLLGALSMLFLRDFLYVLRIRLLLDRKISWGSAFIIIILWEFSSAVTPSAIGGGIIAVFLFLREGIKLGKAIAYVLVSAVFDNYFFLFAVPLSYFGLLNKHEVFSNNFLFTSFWVSYFLIFLYAFCMSCALFWKPDFFKLLMVKITSVKFLQRFRNKAIDQGDELIQSSKVLKEHGLNFWMIIFIITFITWGSRYLILNFIIDGFVTFSFTEHIGILCKHLIIWITMLISPTPGGSGIIEYCFNVFYKDILGNYTIIISIIWRMLTYYVYLFLGLLILPSWLKNFKKNRSKKVLERSSDDSKNVF